MTLTFVERSTFTKSLDAFFSNDEAYRLFQNDLLANPEKGEVMRGTGGLRKIRWTDSARGKGTRGGIRVIYFYVPDAKVIYLLLAYNKDRQDDLTSEQQRRLEATVTVLRDEARKL